MNLREGLGFQRLSPQEQQAYRMMLMGFSVMALSLDCSRIDRNVDLKKVFSAALGDNPSVIYFNKTKFEVEESGLEKKLFFTGIYSKPQAEKMNSSLDEAANKIVKYVKMVSNDEYSLLINIYEFFQKKIRYDKEELQANSRGISNNPDSHNAYGALVNRLAVCDGFSSAFSLIAQKLGFECMLVVGRSTYLTALQEHAWNIIKVKNKFYHLDITWDTRKYNEFDEYSYAYFAVTDEEIANDHAWDKTTTPICLSNDLSYYLKNGIYANNAEQLKQIIKTYGSKKSDVLRIKLSRIITLPSNAGEHLIQMVLNEEIKPGERKQASYSWNEKTRCFFAKIVTS